MSRYFFLLTFLSCVSFAAPETALHPDPKDPTLISKELYANVKTSLVALPAPGSEAQKRDEDQLRKAQKRRTSKDCDAAKEEVYVSLDSFYGPKSKLLSKAEVEKMAPFFENLRNDADYFIQKLKKDYPRKRPFLYMNDIQPCVPREVTGAYPSGHSVLARLFALTLSEIKPSKKSDFEKRGDEIAQHRVDSGMHHPSDIEAGKSLANFLFTEFQKSKAFTDQLAKLKN